MKQWFMTLASIGIAIATTAVAGAGQLVEPPALMPLVESGKLPPLAQRLPDNPAILAMNLTGQSPGRHGGTLNTIMARSKDVRLMVVYGYARLVKFNRKLELVPDILERIDVEEGKVFTLHLRPGHKWSDGKPFTSEDFRYYWQDVANNKDLSPFGPDNRLVVDGELPKVEIIDETTVRYSWSKPNPFFLPALAGAAPLYIYRPAHYLKAFHARYADPARLARLVKKAGVRNWAALHHRRDRQYRNDNPALPTLQPWVAVTRAPSERFIFRRNPYYHRVDPEGRQLPYIDRVTVDIVASSIIPAKTGAGDADLQARGLRFDNYTFLKQAEKRNDYTVRLWRTAKGSHMALYPNLNVADPAWRALMRDVRFRRALSLGINRHEVNQVIYFGLALEGGDAPLPVSPLYRKAYTKAWARLDIAEANRLLDEIGLTERNGDGIRLMPDGRPLNIIVETAGESTEQTDVLELVADSWKRIGIKLFSKPSQREVFRNRIFSGQTMMSIWAGLENGIPTPDMSPDELAPTSQQQLQWPKWGQYFQSEGKAGEAPDMAIPERLIALNRAWRGATDTAARARIWHAMLKLYTDQAYSIGVVGGVLQPVVVGNRLRNVPKSGVYNWDPGAYFGLYRPETFWFVDGRRRRKTSALPRDGARRTGRRWARLRTTD